MLAIQTIETIAALHELADQALVLLVDQLEMLLIADAGYQRTLFSLIKKLVEQVAAHSGLILIAGNEESWKLPRDVGPRMITREPITIGNLNEAETAKFLEAYLEGYPEKFSSPSISKIRSLAGGNPREIFKIASQAYTKTEGNISSITEVALIASALDSGSIADRERLALEIIEQTMRPYGDIRPALDLGEGSVLQRVLTVNNQPRLGVMTITARDRLEEVDSARLVNSTKDKFKGKWAKAQLLVIAVGYSSQEIVDLLESRTKVIVFDRYDQLANQTNTFVIEALSQQNPQSDENGQTDEISISLDRIEESREQRQRRAEIQFQTGVQESKTIF